MTALSGTNLPKDDTNQSYTTVRVVGAEYDIFRGSGQVQVYLPKGGKAYEIDILALIEAYTSTELDGSNYESCINRIG